MVKKVIVAALLLSAWSMVLLGIRPDAARGQAGTFRVLSSRFFLVGDNVYYSDFLNPPFGWRQLPFGPYSLPPVPASSLVSFDPNTAVTDTGEGWIFNGGWQDIGPLPGVVAVELTNWGSLKARYR